MENVGQSRASSRSRRGTKGRPVVRARMAKPFRMLSGRRTSHRQEAVTRAAGGLSNFRQMREISQTKMIPGDDYLRVEKEGPGAWRDCRQCDEVEPAPRRRLAQGRRDDQRQQADTSAA